MKKTILLFTLLVTSFITNALNAAVLIQSRDGNNQTTSIFIEDNKARIEMPNREGYVVMDVANKTMKAVIHRHRSIMDMSDFLKNNTNSSPTRYIDTYTKTMGLGPTIVGYETEQYGLYANDNYCGSLYVSVEAMRDMGVKKFARLFIDMQKNMQAKISQLTGGMDVMTEDPCTVAKAKASLKLRDLGFPLKSIDQNKRLESVIINVNKKARLPANAFLIPADYNVTNPSKIMNDAMPQMQHMMKNMTPEMREMMRQQMRQMQGQQ